MSEVAERNLETLPISEDEGDLPSQVQMMHSTPKPQISSKKRKRNLDYKIADSLDEAKKLL